jgi:hypothetical protein
VLLPVSPHYAPPNGAAKLHLVRMPFSLTLLLQGLAGAGSCISSSSRIHLTTHLLQEAPRLDHPGWEKGAIYCHKVDCIFFSFFWGVVLGMVPKAQVMQGSIQGPTLT